MKDTIVVNKKNSSYDVDITRNGKWGNPYIIGIDGDREEVIRLYGIYVNNLLTYKYDFFEELRGKILGCVCKPLSCHGDVIVKALEK